MMLTFSVQRFKRSLFAVLSRTCVAVYSRFPVFGALRAAVAVIRNGDQVLVIERSDGRGFSFPGGFCSPWETDAQAVAREIFEETGLRVTESVFLFRYRTPVEIPCAITVFEAVAVGELTGSWEGSPQWRSLAEIQPLLLPSQKLIVERLLENSREASAAAPGRAIQ